MTRRNANAATSPGVVKPTISPSAFMKARRPELFSDSVLVEDLVLERSRLEYHLDTLTSRNEEKIFEHYARRICEKLICPALVPQTGPTGGGDSKVDAENYPVAAAIAERWYVGDASKAGTARLAFAFSAKKDWLTKVKADVASIASTHRGYEQVYFVTNQAVPDKRRGKAQDELARKHGFGVTILDKTWLVERTLSAKLIEIAVSTLGIGDLERLRSKTFGGADQDRLTRMTELEAQIADPERYRSAEHQLVEDCLEAALLDRGLGSPQEEVLAQFDRAQRMAERYGTRGQRMRVTYLRFWTQYWWFDDIAAVRRGFETMVQEFLEGASAWDIDSLVNLDIAVQASRAVDGFTPASHYVDARNKVMERLQHLAKLRSHPTQALWSRTLLVFMQWLDAHNAGDTKAQVQELRAILRAAKDLPEYPLESLLSWFAVLLEVMPLEETLEQFADEVAGVTSRRASVGANVEVRTQLAKNHLNQGDPYAAIRQLGKAQIAMHDYRNISEQAALWRLGAAAYDAAGLKWASRSALLAVANTVIGQAAQTGRLPTQGARLMWHLAQLDLRLGQPATALRWLANWRSLVVATAPDDEARARYEDDDFALQLGFGLNALLSSPEALMTLADLPELFESSQLPMSTVGALVALGYEDEVTVDASTTTQDVLQTAAQWMAQPFARDFSTNVEWRTGSSFMFKASLLGVTFEVKSEPSRDCALFCEAFLGFLEVLMVTAISRRAMPRRETLRLETHVAAAQENLTWTISEDDCGETVLHVAVPAAPDDPTGPFVDGWLRLAIEVCVLSFHMDHKSLHAVFGSDDAGVARASALAHVPVMLANLTGTHYPGDSEWMGRYLARPTAHKYESKPYRRVGPLRDALPTVVPPPSQKDRPAAESTLVTHDRMKTVGVINTELWDRARWNGMLYAHVEGGSPIVGLVFTDQEAGRKIFRGWHKRFGLEDTHERLHVGVLLDVDRQSPMHYRAFVTVSLDSMSQGEDQILVSLVRSNTMEPTSHRSIEMFLAAFRQHGRYSLALAGIGEDGAGSLDTSFSIVKTKFSVEHAWTIGGDNPLCMALRPTDDPIVPEGQDDPPVATALRFIRGQSKRTIKGGMRFPSASKR